MLTDDAVSLLRAFAPFEGRMLDDDRRAALAVESLRAMGCVEPDRDGDRFWITPEGDALLVKFWAASRWAVS